MSAHLVLFLPLIFGLSKSVNFISSVSKTNEHLSTDIKAKNPNFDESKVDYCWIKTPDKKTCDIKLKKVIKKIKNSAKKIKIRDKLFEKHQKEHLYNIPDYELEKYVSGLPKSDENYHYWVEIEKNNVHGKITLTVYGRFTSWVSAIKKEKHSKTTIPESNILTYTIQLQQKIYDTQKKFANPENIIKERTFKLENARQTGTAFVLDKEKDSSTYYIATNKHVILDDFLIDDVIDSNPIRWFYLIDSEGQYFSPENIVDVSQGINIKKYDGMKMSVFKDFSEKNTFKSLDDKTKCWVSWNRKEIDCKDVNVSLDLVLLKVTFAEQDPFKEWWDKRPTFYRPMNHQDMLNINSHYYRQDDEYYYTDAGIRSRENGRSKTLERGPDLVKNKYIIGGYPFYARDCDYWNNIISKEKNNKFIHSVGLGETYIEAFAELPFNSYNTRITFPDKELAFYGGSSGSPTFDKNFNLIGINWGGELNQDFDVSSIEFDLSPHDDDLYSPEYHTDLSVLDERGEDIVNFEEEEDKVEIPPETITINVGDTNTRVCFEGEHNFVNWFGQNIQHNYLSWVNFNTKWYNFLVKPYDIVDMYGKELKAKGITTHLMEQNERKQKYQNMSNKDAEILWTLEMEIQKLDEKINDKKDEMEKERKLHNKHMNAKRHNYENARIYQGNNYEYIKKLNEDFFKAHNDYQNKLKQNQEELQVLEQEFKNTQSKIEKLNQQHQT